MQEIKLGDVSATRVVEYYGDAGTSPGDNHPWHSRGTVAGEPVVAAA